jgi:hypothetical protein
VVGFGILSCRKYILGLRIIASTESLATLGGKEVGQTGAKCTDLQSLRTHFRTVYTVLLKYP